MQCAKCHSLIEDDPLDTPEACPHCGAALDEVPLFEADAVERFEPQIVAAEPFEIAVEPVDIAAEADDAPAVAAVAVAAPAAAGVAVAEKTARPKPAPKAKGARGAMNTFLTSFLLVGMATLAAGSTFVALRAIDQRDRAEFSSKGSSQALEQTLVAAANTSRLKGPLNAQARQEIFTPARQMYEAFIAKHASDSAMQPQVADAYLHLAGLQAKLGDANCVGSLSSALRVINTIKSQEGYDPATIPRLKIALQLSAPTDWATVKTSSFEGHVFGLIMAIGTATSTYTELSAAHPANVPFREDLVEIHRVSGQLQSQVEARKPFALRSWIAARDVLESLLREQPGSVDYQNRLVEALVGAAQLQIAKEPNEAITNFKRAIEVREQMVAANPDDKTLAEDLARLKTSLANVKPGATETAPAETAAADQPPAE